MNHRSPLHWVLVAVIAFLAAFGTVHWLPAGVAGKAPTESILQRVGTYKNSYLRLLVVTDDGKNLNTGAMKGVVVDITKEVAAALGASEMAGK